MCRNIHTLFNYEPPATHEEVRDASLQYVRKISGFTKPSQANEEAFARAVDEVAEASRRLLDQLVTAAAPKDRAVEAERKRARAAVRPSGGPAGSSPLRSRAPLTGWSTIGSSGKAASTALNTT